MAAMKQTAETVDLTKHAMERVRKTVMTVAVLIEDDAQRASLLMACAADLMDGAAHLLSDKGQTSHHDAVMTTVASVLFAIDDPTIQRMMNAILTKSSRASR